MSGATLALSTLASQANCGEGEGAAAAAIHFLKDGILWCQEYTGNEEEEEEGVWERRVAAFDRITHTKSLKALNSLSDEDGKFNFF